MTTLHTTNHQDAFIASAEDCSAAEGVVPPSRATPSTAELTHGTIASP